MMFRTSSVFVAPLCASALLLAASASAADTPPEKAVGLTGATDAVGQVDLAPHNLPGALGDYELRARTIGIAPDGGIPGHPHAGRPGIARVTKGSLVEYRGAAERTLQVGDTWYETADTVHWFRNPSSTEAAELWVVDVVLKKK